jgi:hypothetical protein
LRAPDASAGVAEAAVDAAPDAGAGDAGINGASAATVPAPPPRSIALPQQLTLATMPARRGAVAPAGGTDFTTAIQSMSQRNRHKKARAGGAMKLLFKLALLAGLIVGGIHAVKNYVLAPKWQEDVKVIADDVAERRGLEWQEAVRVEVLPRAEYAALLAETVLGVGTDAVPAVAAEWRAMGLAEGTVDLAAVGRAAVADQLAFYDADDGTIHQLDGLSPELREFALSRALTMALLDQEFGWSDEASSAEPGRRIATRAVFDGDAASVQAATSQDMLTDPQQSATVSNEVATIRIEAAAGGGASSPYAVAVIASTADATAPLFHSPITGAADSALESVAVASDAAVFDGARARTSVPVDLAVAGAKSVGMLYWYYALAGRVGSDAAWAAAVTWNGDASTVRTSAGSTCVSSTISTLEEDGRATMLDALRQWAELAPAGSTTTVAPAGEDRIDVQACDPGATADTIRSSDIRLLGNAPYELAVVGAMLRDGLADTDEARACVVNSLRGGQVVPVTEPSGVDRSLTRPLVDLGSADATVLMDTCGTL